MSTPESYVKVTPGGGSVHVGAQAVSRFQLIAVKGGLRSLIQFGRPVNTAYTAKNLLALTSRITGKTYKGRDKLALAMADVEAEIAKTEIGLPLIVEA